MFPSISSLVKNARHTSKIFVFPAGIYLLKVNEGHSKTMSKTYLKLTIKTEERHYLGHSAIFIVKFERILHIALVYPFLTLNKEMSTSKLVGFIHFYSSFTFLCAFEKQYLFWFISDFNALFLLELSIV